jgi:hypothetical protein
MALSFLTEFVIRVNAFALELAIFNFLGSGYKKTSITALRSHWQPVIYVSKLLAANSSQALFLTFFITPLKKTGVF